MGTNHISSSRASRYLVSFAAPADHIAVRLICFPFAGAGASLYAPWSRLLPSCVEIIGVELPGRGLRALEEPVERLEDHLQPLASALAQRFDKPVAFFGHSMGAVLAFEVAYLLHSEYGRSPVHLFASGARCPSLGFEIPARAGLTDLDLVQLLRQYNGTPSEVLENAELLDLIFPALRADLLAIGNYKCNRREPLACSITAIGGEEDPFVERSELEGWRTFTNAEFAVQMVPGDHFFLKSNGVKLMERLRQTLDSFIKLAELGQECQPNIR
jgi:medium-chain acyl-[acyl-carrier-protein] hydrolase